MTITMNEWNLSHELAIFVDCTRMRDRPYFARLNQSSTGPKPVLIKRLNRRDKMLRKKNRRFAPRTAGSRSVLRTFSRGKSRSCHENSKLIVFLDGLLIVKCLFGVYFLLHLVIKIFTTLFLFSESRNE